MDTSSQLYNYQSLEPQFMMRLPCLQGQVTSWLSAPVKNFRPLDTLDNTVVFQMIVNNHNGVRTVTLTTDGKLTTTELLYDLPSDEIASETISMPPEEVVSFKALLQQQRFSNFDRMSYENEDSMLVIHGGTTFRTPDAIVEESARQEDLPVGLQTILEAWWDAFF